ncbi:hypothetical protein [Oceanobacillus polygoni]|uniref:Uncharacterized protein n=1 Tax=Oceanobacillus polygoni TaxID=1235259 RepID=A0A9X0Z0X3_9BACI|nr:hypothetical protein [Oceanobacillus polygoni]MBP2079634.1 hypothetical protein [Oceanobacillus polygoni]
MKLNDLLKRNKVVAFGFPAVKDLIRYDNKDSENTVIISALSPSQLVEHGINEYYGLELPRDTVFETGLDIIKSNINVYKYCLTALEIYPLDNRNDFIIVSRHKGTIQILKEEFPFLKDVPIFERVESSDIKGKHVFGTLPHHMIADCDLYTSVSIKGFDYNKDGDLNGSELKERIQIAEYPIMLEKLN